MSLSWAHILAVLGKGLGITVLVTVGAAMLALVVSVVAGMARAARNGWMRTAAASYIAVFRGTSALVQLFWVYYALPLVGLRMPAIWAGIVVLGLNTAAYGAEVVRGALGAVPEGQREAGLALGFSRRQIMWRIIFPQAALRMIPPMGNLMIELLKNSSLVSLITLADLTFQGKEILRSEYPQETTLIFGALLAVYFVLAQALSQGSQWLERRLAVGRDYGGM